ncbi:PREDICTED: uncharacterized protein LOC107188323 [Dufourea novaeangliae]|uniref:uncharacterized protein LOC107188323 n=1 Tax=Dufourea novaeangliae TaxID=178035 RepID=UPI00076774D2|nr:PREDICTED: uncharacterized protein LOC107188323 [Dufourea novaeangliae]
MGKKGKLFRDGVPSALKFLARTISWLYRPLFISPYQAIFGPCIGTETFKRFHSNRSPVDRYLVRWIECELHLNCISYISLFGFRQKQVQHASVGLKVFTVGKNRNTTEKMSQRSKNVPNENKTENEEEASTSFGLPTENSGHDDPNVAEVVLSNKGGPKLIHNGYMYTLHKKQP